jgi:predicted PhzF superfamily epimerase YddE/YHI9
MRIPYYHIDAFTSDLFGGNPAGVCTLQEWLPDRALQQIAAENRHSETAFTIPQGADYALRWFTPSLEVDLCGHATLAAAYVHFTYGGHAAPAIRFHSPSGLLTVAREGDRLVLDFPSRPGTPCSVPEALVRGLGQRPLEVLKQRDYLAVLPSQADVANLQPDVAALGELDVLGIIATALGDDVDFVSRFFAPRAGIAEDPVTGSSHCTLIPYWSRRLGKRTLHALQLSARGGELFCEDAGDRVRIGGRAVTYLRGEIDL